MIQLRMLCPVLLLSLGLTACGPSGAGGPGDSLVVSGRVEQGDDLQVYFDRLNGPTAAFEKVASTQADAQGAFTLAVPEALEAGVYRLRFGARKLPLVLDGNETEIEVGGSMSGLQQYDYTVSGAPAAASLQVLLRRLATRELGSADVANYIDTVSNAFAGAYAAELALGANGVYLDAHKRARERLSEQAGDQPYAADYDNYVKTVEATYATQLAQERIAIGAEAPEIALPSPDGEEYRLSDLKGKVVLLDFWASWCGPCRRENPNVVEVYDKYKDQGFTVFSVSLDGLDGRMKQALSTQEQIDKQTAASKERWVKAIEQDQLKWPYHVSDLQKWNSLAARTYGVGSIPRTFLIDRDGRIAALNTRGRLEEEVRKVL